ncbi:MAG: NAD(P)H-binding protein [Actinobacteria bacterium]|nr:NAD(P)H-binding protein [Actinomycetota bacterium]
MSTVLVTGGAGNLGRHVSRVLARRGHRVRVLVHESDRVVPGVEVVRGDVVEGTGIAEAVEGVDAIVHTATRSGRSARRTEVGGTETMLRAAERVAAHFVYVSKVGVENHRLTYCSAKWEAEQRIEAIGTRWTIQRVTEFHDLIEQVLGSPVFFTVPGLVFQPIDVGEVAIRLADLVERGPSGRVPDLGGPELLGIRDLEYRRWEITGERSRLLRLPRIGALADFADGFHLCPENRGGTITWEDWLRRRAGIAAAPPAAVAAVA